MIGFEGGYDLKGNGNSVLLWCRHISNMEDDKV